MSTTASLACQALITRYTPAQLGLVDRWMLTAGSKPAEIPSPRGDLIRRAFWYCSMIETYVPNP